MVTVDTDDTVASVGNFLQSATVVDAAIVTLPSGQSVQLALPTVSLYFPGAHASQSLPVSINTYPALQVQLEVLKIAPFGHSTTTNGPPPGPL